MSADIDVVAGPSGADLPERQDSWPLNLFESLRRSASVNSGAANRPRTETQP